MMATTSLVLLLPTVTTALTASPPGHPQASMFAQTRGRRLRLSAADEQHVVAVQQQPEEEQQQQVNKKGEVRDDERGEEVRRRAQAASGTLQTDRDALLAFKAASEAAAPGGDDWPASLHGWGRSTAAAGQQQQQQQPQAHDNVCSWGGVTCAGGRVTELRLCRFPINADEDHISMYTDATHHGTWNDVDGTTTALEGYVCANTPIFSTYTYFTASGITWADARNRCVRAGGDLASIHSARQNADVLDATRGSSVVWIGLTDSQTEGEWRWSDGTAFNFHNWNPGEPNNGGPVLGACTLSLADVGHVRGNVVGLAPLTALQKLWLHSTQVTGDVAGLAPLTALQRLDLRSTQVAGDVVGLAPLTMLQQLWLSFTYVTGDVAGLAPLIALQLLDMDTTHVTGDGRGVCSSCGSR
jgi:hypothetical protein